MGAGYSQLFPCFNPAVNRDDDHDVAFTATDSLDETLGHSFCYVRSSARFVSPTHSDRFLSPSQSLRFDPDPVQKSRQSVLQEPGFRSISGASVCANTSTPRTVLQIDSINDNATDNTCASGSTVIQYASGFSSGVKGSVVNGFEGTSSFSALPLQLVPRSGAGGGCSRQGSGQFERALFMSGPIQRGALSGPLDSSNLEGSNGVPFSAPLGGMYAKKKRRKGISAIRKAFSGKFMESKRPWVVPERNNPCGGASNELESNAQWALGKAGEDRVHVVVSEEHGWLFVGIYDGFNGPDAPEFLMSNLYRTMYKELEGLFWDIEDSSSSNILEVNVTTETLTEVENSGASDSNQLVEGGKEIEVSVSSNVEDFNKGSVKKVTFQSGEIAVRRRRLWEFLAEDNAEEGLDLSGSDRFAFSVDDAITVSNARSSMSKRSLLLSKLKHGFLGKHKENTSFFRKEKQEAEMQENRVQEEQGCTKSGKRRKTGPVDPDQVLGAMSRALDLTELAYLDMTDKVLDKFPELALMGSCLLVVLMRDEDVYVMNVGDSRAIVAQYEPKQATSSTERSEHGDNVSNTAGIVEEAAANAIDDIEENKLAANESMKLNALQLSTDHSTSIDEEVVRIKNEHPDDSNCIANDRVKGRLKVTRAFGAGFLKKPKLNDALLEMFRNEYIGTAPYISCTPSLCHHRLCPKDQFLVLSSDGLYQYFTNQEVVSFVENFMENFPDGDPAQYLIEELLVRAAKKAGMDFHELLDIPQGDRRKYHDDVTVMVISLEGRIWKSSGKYP